ncbi:glycoside hydrolase family 32 protein [Flagellimonas sp.]|uniref:glycoside hydrolase family 32 protein n=1 Tax=Flagellimonas sp. TaxID=2058762 RepID=UPI003BAB77A9
MKKLLTHLFLFVLIGILNTSCKDKISKPEEESKTIVETKMDEEQLYRPNLHFTPKSGWMNDPNGMFYYNGYYHLYFQHYPDGNKWGPMHWGHAVSTDLVNWKELPIALYPDEKGYIFSGSAIVDFENRSGFGKDGQSPIVAIYTYHDPKLEKTESTDVETQAIAYSLDEGLTWTKYKGNPVVKNPGIRDFRDPKVFWDENSSQFVMTLAADQKVMFYSSKNLKNWTYLSDFGEGIGNHNGVWECPDLFPLMTQDTNEEKYVLLVSINPGGPNGGSATQYFIGDFIDGKFIVDETLAENMAKQHDYWIDFGKDNYAGVTWSNVDLENNGKLFIGWMSNWQYANEVPTEKWRSATTVPRELRLYSLDNDYRLSFEPTKSLNDFKAKKLKKEVLRIGQEPLKIVDSKTLGLNRTRVDFTLKNSGSSSFTATLKNDNGKELLFGFDNEQQTFFIDRSKSGKTEFSKEFASKQSTAPRIRQLDDLKLTAIIDKTSLELFYDDGITVMTEIFFPNKPFEELWISSKNEETQLEAIELHELKTNINFN